MAVYNCQNTVAEAIESILDQTFQDFEFVICDDCSDDGTYQIVCNYAERYPDKIVVVRNEKNSKLAYSLNHCLRNVRGKYIARMDGDDASVPERFEKQYDFLQKNRQYDLVGTAMSFFDESGEWGKVEKNQLPSVKDKLGGVCFNHATIMIKKSAYDCVGNYTDIPRTLRCEDIDLWYKLFAAGLKGYNTKDVLYRVRVDEDAMKRRSFALRLNVFKTMSAGYKLMNFPWPYYIFLLKPLIAGLIPNRMMLIYHKIVFNEK